MDQEDNKITIILIHNGLDSSNTLRLLSKIDQKFLSVITKIELNDELDSWIKCNSKGVVVKSYPCFLVTINGNTIVYDNSEYQKVIDIISELI